MWPKIEETSLPRGDPSLLCQVVSRHSIGWNFVSSNSNHVSLSFFDAWWVSGACSRFSYRHQKLQFYSSKYSILYCLILVFDLSILGSDMFNCFCLGDRGVRGSFAWLFLLLEELSQARSWTWTILQVLLFPRWNLFQSRMGSGYSRESTWSGRASQPAKARK